MSPIRKLAWMIVGSLAALTWVPTARAQADDTRPEPEAPALPARAPELHALLARAQERYRDKDYEGARQDAEAALQLAPEDLGTLRFVGLLRLYFRDHAAAVAALTRAVAGSPRDADAWLWLGDAYRAQGNLAAARAAHRRALQLAPDSARARERLRGAPRRSLR